LVEEVRHALRLVRAVRLISEMHEAGVQNPGRRVLVWRQGATRVDTYDAEGRRFHSTPFIDHAAAREEAEKLAEALEWDFEVEGPQRPAHDLSELG
jgi:hypothetical protein